MKRTLAALLHELDTKKFYTREEMRQTMWDFREVSEELLKKWKHLNCKINKVTAPYRHGAKVSDKVMVDLCNTQQDVWDDINKIVG